MSAGIIKSSKVDDDGRLGGGPEIRFFFKKDGRIRRIELISTRTPSIENPRKIGLHTLSEMFLPSGFPDSVTPDYVRYQIFDSLQAFSSSIAGLLSSRAVLEGFGVGDENASSTNAVLLSVVQDATGRLATILFAWKIGPALAPEAKMYRFAADICIDSALLLDCLSPALPTKLRIATFCLAGSLRSICGVCAGGSKAALSVHFTRVGNVAELNAKDASQETVIGLLGTLCGSFIMARITSRPATWAALAFLLIVHLGTNYLAVRAVTLTTLNRRRANIVYGLYSEGDGPGPTASVVPSPSEVAKGERIFEIPPSIIRDPVTGAKLGTCSICSSTEELLRSSQGPSFASSWMDALKVFRDEPYVLLPLGGARAGGACKLLMCFKRRMQAEDFLKAWVTAFELCRIVASRVKKKRGESGGGDERSLAAAAATWLLDMRSALDQVHRKFPDFLEKAKRAGWDVSTNDICTGPVPIIDITIDGDGDEKKE